MVMTTATISTILLQLERPSFGELETSDEMPQAIQQLIESLLCWKRPFGPLSLHQPSKEHLTPITVTPHFTMAHAPTLHSPGNYGQFSMANAPKPAPEHPKEIHADAGRMCKLHADSNSRLELNPVPWCCDPAALTTEPSCCPVKCSKLYVTANVRNLKKKQKVLEKHS
eukprot:g34017.t1